MNYKTIIALMAVYPLTGCYSGLNKEQSSQFDKIKQDQISLKKRIKELKNRIVILERNDSGDSTSKENVLDNSDNPDHIPVLKLKPTEQSQRRKNNNNTRYADGGKEKNIFEEEIVSVDDRKSVKLKLYGNKSSSNSKSKPLALGTYHELQEPDSENLVGNKNSSYENNNHEETPSKLYELARLKFKSGRYPMALILFSKLLKRFPESRFADNAIFWMGECHYRQGRFKIALSFYERVIKKYKTGNKVPDSIYKMGMSYWKLNHIEKSKKLLNQVMELYPGTATAKKAAKILVKLR